jgi:hypothetical protein
MWDLYRLEQHNNNKLEISHTTICIYGNSNTLTKQTSITSLKIQSQQTQICTSSSCPLQQHILVDSSIPKTPDWTSQWSTTGNSNMIHEKTENTRMKVTAGW